MGSGKILVHALKKYGPENFEKTILHVYSTAEEMWNKERDLVYVSEETYNLKEGGTGGWDYVNTLEKQRTLPPALAKFYGKQGGIALKKKFENDLVFAKLYSISCSNGQKKRFIHDIPPMKNKYHSAEAKEKIGKANSIHQKGNGNSQYGTCWVTNGIENKKIQKSELDKWIEKGFKLGRFLKSFKKDS